MSGTATITEGSRIKKRRDGQVEQNSITNIIDGSGTSPIGDSIPYYFEIVNKGTADEYVRCKKPLGSLYDVLSYAGESIPNIWDDLPVASATVLGGIKVGNNLTITDGVLSATGGVPSYPGAGIAVSTGSAWAASVTNNSSNWNTAYSWGNHASAGYLTAITKAMVEAVLTGTITSHNHSGVYDPAGTASSVMTTHQSSYNHANIANGQTAYSWGNHASYGYLTSITKAMVEAVLTGTITSHNHSGVYDPVGTASSVITTHQTTYNHSNYNTAYSHSQNNNQAHSDYLKNDASDYMNGTLTCAGDVIAYG